MERAVIYKSGSQVTVVQNQSLSAALWIQEFEQESFVNDLNSGTSHTQKFITNWDDAIGGKILPDPRQTKGGAIIGGPIPGTKLAKITCERFGPIHARVTLEYIPLAQGDPGYQDSLANKTAPGFKLNVTTSFEKKTVYASSSVVSYVDIHGQIGFKYPVDFYQMLVALPTGLSSAGVHYPCIVKIPADYTLATITLTKYFTVRPPCDFRSYYVQPPADILAFFNIVGSTTRTNAWKQGAQVPGDDGGFNFVQTIWQYSEYGWTTPDIPA